MQSNLRLYPVTHLLILSLSWLPHADFHESPLLFFPVMLVSSKITATTKLKYFFPLVSLAVFHKSLNNMEYLVCEEGSFEKQGVMGSGMEAHSES